MNDASRPDADVTLSPSSSVSLFSVLRLWFGFSLPVNRRAYILSGLFLATVKYLWEAFLCYLFMGKFLTPQEYFNPFLSGRLEIFRQGAVPDWVLWVIAWDALPFLWIALTMSTRRALDAGVPPWVALAAAIPGLNYLLFLWLCLMPSRLPDVSRHSEENSQGQSAELPESFSALRSAMWGMLSAGGLGLVLLLLNVYGLEDYGSLLFFGTPLMMGVVMGGVFNSPVRRSVLATIGVALLTMTVASFFLLCTGLEGAICIFMMLPLAMPVCAIGAVLGRWLVSLEYTGTGLPWAAMLILPIMAGTETLLEQTPEYVVLTSVEIDAPPETVWRNVIHFPDLPEPEEWYFRAGIACPTGARIEGSGVGAVRRCLFTTGAFVEPITAWEPGRRLAFDVTEQPDPMFELSPYRDLHPPHLQGYLICRRGEFRLVALPGGRTRLEGRTWYTFDMHPQSYWTLWSRFFIRRIHRRVLLHVKELSEKEAARSADRDRAPPG